MAEIQPFKSVNYNVEFAGELDALITPPYDVISPEQQNGFYDKNPYNVIRLVLAKQMPDDNEKNNKYSRAADTLAQWLKSGILVQDNEPSFTIYQMEFSHPEKGRMALDGIVALVKVDDYGKGKVLPHEKTYKGPKLDQLNLMRACKANLTPIHGLFDDADDLISAEYRNMLAREPDQVARDNDGSIHRTWKIKNRKVIENIKNILAPKSLFIADGHHRYETALNYKRDLEAAGKAIPNGPQDYVMIYLTSMSHPGLTILPAHRMVKNLPNIAPDDIRTALQKYFEIDELQYDMDSFDHISHKVLERIRNFSDIGGKFGMIITGENKFNLLKLKDFNLIDKLIDSNIPKDLKGLDVTILREIIMTRGLGMDMENAEGKIEYTPSVTEAMEKAMKGQVQISFILNPTRVDQMRVAAELGHKLPHKSTYFFPKISSGLVINLFT